MNRFTSIDELRTFLRKDRSEVSLCPVRFINVDSMEMWVSVKKLLLSMSKSHICLSSFCSQDDTTPNMRRFAASIKNITASVCVSPLSEFLRVNPDIAKSTINDILAKDYPGNSDGKLRIYIPMYRMKSILQTIPNSDPRKKDCILMLTTGEDTDYSLTVIQNNLQVSIAGNEIFGFKQYLQYWEQNPDKPLILHTENAIHYSKRVFFDNVRVIVTAFNLLSAYYNLPTIYSEADGTEKLWNQLAQIVASEQTFEDACCHEFLINKYSSRLFEKWTSFTGFQKWLLWMWARAKQPADYLGQCINNSKCVDQFVELVYTQITNLVGDAHFGNLYAERNELIKRMQVDVPASFWRAADRFDTLDRLRVLSDNTASEREAIFNLLKEIPGADRSEAISILKSSYPSLGVYLDSAAGNFIEDLPDDISDYFAQYRWYKAANVLPVEFVDQVKMFASQKGAPVYALKSRNLIVSEEYDENSAIIFSDGLGVEYVNYIYSILSSLKNDGYTIRLRAGYCNLPSTTAINKDFLSGRRVAAELLDPDEMKHGSSPYPKAIENELSFLDSLKEKIRNAFSPSISRVILTTDHGTSRMAVLVRSTEFDLKIPAKGHAIYKYGRYCEGIDMADELPTAIEYNGKLIFADYTRFEQKGAPIDETHGGASLEEWLVPIIVIEKSGERKAKLSITIIPPAGQLRPDSMTKKVTVKFSLESYDGNDVSVRIHGKKTVCKKADTHYEFEYLPIKEESEIEAIVYAGSNNVGKFKFFVKQGISQNKMFDLL